MSAVATPGRTRGGRKLSRPVYRFLLATHVAVAGVWLGVVIAKLLLFAAAVTAGTEDAAESLRGATEVVDLAFPPTAVGTLVTGVLLSLGTKWGLLRHYWVATKLAVTVAVIAVAIPARGGGLPLDVLLALSAAYVVLLGFATVVSIYKPWGRTAARKPRPRAGKVDATERLQYGSNRSVATHGG